MRSFLPLPAPRLSRRHGLAPVCAAMALACLLALPPGPVRYLAALALTLAPGFAPCWPPSRFSTDNMADGLFLKAVLGSALGFGVSTLCFLVCTHAGLTRLHPAAYPALQAAFGTGVFLLPAARNRGRAPLPALLPGRWTLVVLAVLAAAVWLRFAHLGYSEFQGDETHSVLKEALSILSGKDHVLGQERRPPLQMAWAAMSQLLAGSMDEFVVRAPFALAGTLACLAAALLGALLFNPAVGALSGLLWALDGLFIAFSRYLQYQSAVCLFLVCATLCLALYSKEKRGGGAPWLVLGCFLYGLAGASHYEGLLFAPAVLFVMRRKGWPRACVPAFAAFLAPAALAYLPMLFSPAFAGHMEFYRQSRLYSPINFNIGYIIGLGTVYTSWGYLLLLSLGTWALFKFPPKGEAERTGRMLVLAWLAPYFATYFILMSTPRTHIYTMYMPWSLLAAAGAFQLPQLLEWLGSKASARVSALRGLPGFLRRPRVSIVLVVLLTGWTALHVHGRFVDHAPEYPWYGERPTRSLFGFPFLRGWDAVGYLYRTGELDGTYATNETERVSRYYMRQDPVGEGAAELFVYSPAPESWKKDAYPPEGFSPILRVMADGKPGLTVYRRGAPADGEVRVVRAKDYDLLFPLLDSDR